MIQIKQKFESPVLNHIARRVASQIKSLELEKRVNKGQTVAVACSSRGIANYSKIVSATIQSLQKIDLIPFIVPAMGSHGAASAEGQKKILEHQGISQEVLGVPIRSSLDTVQIGKTKNNIPIFLDKIALTADYIVPINRIKSHTDFAYEIESGLMKLMVIGLGKQKGASIYHQAFFNYGYARTIITAARNILSSGRILFGAGIVENGTGQTADIAILRPEELESGERELLKEAKRLELKLPFQNIDILIIEEMGKDISGAGIDTKIIGRIHTPLIAEEPESPKIKRIIVNDLTEASDGNAVGVGLADFITRRLFDKISMEATYINAITGGTPEQAKIPMVLKNDKKAIEVAADSIGMITPLDLKIIRIKNTKQLSTIAVSQAYKKDILQRRDLEIINEKRPLVFNKYGNLEPL